MGKQEGHKAFSKLTRLLRLVEYIAVNQKDGGVPWEKIKAEIYGNEYATDESLLRKFRRDIKDIADIYADDLLDNGEIPVEAAVITKNKYGKYIIQNGLNLMLPTKLNEDEALALMSSVCLVPEFVSAFENASNKLWLRLKNQMSNEVLEKCEILTKAIVSAIPIAKSTNDEIFKLILDALHEKKYIEISEYQKVWPDDPEKCKFAPQIIYLKYHSWYVLGAINDKTKILRLDRIKSASLSHEEQEFLPSIEELARDIQLDYNPFEKMPKGGWKVKLRITGSFVQPCMETKWFPDEEKIFNKKDNSLIYSVTLKGLEEITLWIMRALNCIEVLEPKELRDRIDARVNEYLKKRK